MKKIIIIMLLKYTLFMFLLFILIKECYQIKCSNEICGGYKFGTLCNYLWSTSYRDCMSYLNRNNKDVIKCFKRYNSTISNSWSIDYNYLNGIIKCNNNSFYGKSKKDINYKIYIKPILIANCIKKSNKLITEDINITCNYHNIYQI